MSFIAGIIPALAFFICDVTSALSFAMAGLGGWATGAFLTYVLSLLVLNCRCPWKKLVLNAEFDGILPTEVRKKVRAAKSHFDKLYLVVDEEHGWKSTLLPDPRSRPLDPLLVAELKQSGRRRFFLIDQFYLTVAEQYLADEFASKRDEAMELGG
jgi:hypothetical protein